MNAIVRRFTRSTLAPGVILTAGAFLPDWIVFPLSIALANGIAALGIVVLMRTGNVTFGQSLFYCVGAYSGAVVPGLVGFNEAVVIIAASIICGLLVAALLGLFLQRFTGIFFAMLTLALAMVLYGLLAKSQALGGTDGISVHAPTFFFASIDGRLMPSISYLFTAGLALLIMVATRRLVSSWIGIAAVAVGKNDIRVSYLGGNVSAITWIVFVYCSVLGAIGGALAGILSGHVAPEMAYWTKSGELVLVAILGNSGNVFMVFIASVIIEAMRVFTATAFPYTWQAALGAMLLAIILLLPNGLDSLLARIGKRTKAVANDK